MEHALKSLENNALAALSSRAPAGVVNAIKTASAKTGVSFSYLMEKAAAESNFNPTVKAKTSSATGLFQFIESTWMDMVNRHGDKYGIDTDQSKSALLELRKDPEMASFMAAEFAGDNKNYLEKTVGGDIGNTELYFAHFMGAGGASAFLNQLNQNPNATAADIFPKAANANRGVFYHANGSARSFEQIYDFFDKKFSDDTAPAVQSLAHKPSKSNRPEGAGYQHIPFSLKKPIQFVNAQISKEQAQAFNSLYQLENTISAFFSKPVSDGYQVASLYGNLKSPSSALLDVLK